MTRKPFYNKFFEQMRKTGCHLLRDDIRFICKQLERIPPERHREALRGYYSKWHEYVSTASNVAQAQNMARKRANLWMLDFGVAQNKKKSLS